MNLSKLDKHFTDSEAAREFLEAQRWPDGAFCPFCGLVGESYRLKAKPDSKSPVRPGVWKCGGCRKQFTVTVGTIFEDSHIPLNVWLMAIHLLCASKKGLSAHQLHRMLGVTYKTAWFMAHRIRYGMTQDPLAEKLSGTVEIDETYIGGKIRAGAHAVKLKMRPKDRPSPYYGKAAVVAMVERDGKVRSKYVERVTANNLRPIIEANIAENARIMTDSGTVLEGTLMGRTHYQVNHRADEYVRYERGGLNITTNTIEGYFSILKRGINGVYHHVGRQHLHRYLTEFDYRYNARKVSDTERSQAVLKIVSGKRIMYKEIVGSEKITSEDF